MTQEEYKRAVEINERIKELNEVRKELESEEHRLFYCWKGLSEWHCCPEWVMSQIGDILAKHDLMIRDEIAEEIGKLKAKIETL